MSFLELRQLEKTYPDGTRAVRGVDLAVEEGEFVVLLGPSGCGKTTSLRMVAGLEIPTGGHIHLAGAEVTARRPAERDVGFVFQFYALYPHLTVWQNVAFPLQCRKTPAAECRRQVDAVLERLGLQGLAKRHPGQLSGGDQQRVSLARAMVRRPQVFLMDEPLGTLDSHQRGEMREFVREQQQDTGVTTLYVTHDQEEAMSLADRIVVMQDGLIQQCAAPGHVYDRPATRFVADFVGSPGMNFLPGRVQGTADGPRFQPEGTSSLLEAPDLAEGPALLGVRAEFVRPGSTGPVSGEVVMDEYRGSFRLLHVETPAGRLVVQGRADAATPVGTTVHLDFDAQHLRYFDAESARALT